MVPSKTLQIGGCWYCGNPEDRIGVGGGATRYSVELSVEKDPSAYRTLLLRAFLRKFDGNFPSEYYDFLNGATLEPGRPKLLSGNCADDLDCGWNETLRRKRRTPSSRTQLAACSWIILCLKQWIITTPPHRTSRRFCKIHQDELRETREEERREESYNAGNIQR